MDYGLDIALGYINRFCGRKQRTSSAANIMNLTDKGKAAEKKRRLSPVEAPTGSQTSKKFARLFSV